MAELAGDGRQVKRFRMAREGQTVDGRVLSRQDIVDMAETYNIDEYGARINVEHISGFSPEPPFNAYGDILLVDAVEENGLLCLYNTISALPNLVAMLAKGQKIYPSIEFIRDFAGRGKAYQVGLGFTDRPASLGTQAIKFNALTPHGPVVRTAPDQEIFIMSQHQPQTFASKISALLTGMLPSQAPAATAPVVTQSVQQPATAQPMPAQTVPAQQPAYGMTPDQQFQAATYQTLSAMTGQQQQLAQAIQLLAHQVQLSHPAVQPTTDVPQPQQPMVTQPYMPHSFSQPPVQATPATQAPAAQTPPTQQPVLQQQSVQTPAPAATSTAPNPQPTHAQPSMEQLMATLVNGQQQFGTLLMQLAAAPASVAAPIATGGAGMANEF